MKLKTYYLSGFGGVPFISDGDIARAYGHNGRYGEFVGSHRGFYNTSDAQAVCDWMNQLARGYPNLKPDVG